MGQKFSSCFWDFESYVYKYVFLTIQKLFSIEICVKKFALKIKYEVIVAFGEKTKSVVEIAKELKVAKNTIYDWIRIKDKIIEQYKSSSGSMQRVKTS